MDDGRRFVEEAAYPFGDFNNPFDWDAAHKKFFALTSDILPLDKVAELSRRTSTLEQYDDINELFADLSLAARGA